MKMLKNLFFVSLCLAVFASCNDDDDNTPKNTSRVKVAMKTSTNELKSAMNTANVLKLNELFINISEIEFDVNDDMEDLLPGNDTVFTDLELKGPFPIDLLSDKSSAGMVLATTNVPNATYEEIEFEFDKYKGSDSKFKNLKDYTIYAAGTFNEADNDVSFIIKSDKDLEIELEYENGGLVLEGFDSKVFIDLSLDVLITNLIQTAGADFETAEREEDGSILISKDKNENILKKFEDAVESAFDVLEDGDED